MAADAYLVCQIGIIFSAPDRLSGTLNIYSYSATVSAAGYVCRLSAEKIHTAGKIERKPRRVDKNNVKKADELTREENASLSVSWRQSGRQSWRSVRCTARCRSH